MPAYQEISVTQLSRLIGTPQCPALIDVRISDDVAADPWMIPGSIFLPHTQIESLAPSLQGLRAVVICQKGKKLSQGGAAWLRHHGVEAENLAGGSNAWRDGQLPQVPLAAIPARDGQGRTVWVTRHRPKIDRIACPWLIRRFIDPAAVFLFVAPNEVADVADRFNATPFDVEGVHWSHRDGRCTFDVMLEEFRLTTEPLLRLADIVRGADTARPELAPESAGLLAASLGLSRMFDNDLAQLEAGMTLYDAFYRWARDATGETHDWPQHTSPSAQKKKA
jgi:rhodanese-related sulfurtransferase